MITGHLIKRVPHLFMEYCVLLEEGLISQGEQEISGIIFFAGDLKVILNQQIQSNMNENMV